jgi:two-component system nitrate/nitrite response regulator NarL
MDNHHVLIVADDPLARAGLAALLGGEPSVTVTGQSSSSVDIAALLAAFQPDVLLWDLGWSPEGQILALGQFVEEYTLPVVALLAVDTLVNSVRSAGARGLLLRTSSGAQMAAALNAVVQGLLVFDTALLATPAPFVPLCLSSGRAALHPRAGGATPAGRRALQQGDRPQAMAISENTIKFHVNAILGKLGAYRAARKLSCAPRAPG